MENKTDQHLLPNDIPRCAVCKYWQRDYRAGNSKNGICRKIDFIYSKKNYEEVVDVFTPRWGLCDKFSRKDKD
jgi:hypothetical protein